jgi:hypothetical protein
MTDPRSGSAPIPRPTPQPPAPLDRESLERVLARAAELQAGQSEPAEQMSEAQLIEVGKEVGISAEHVRLALAEERTRVQVPEARGVVGSLFGGEAVTASRVVNGTATDLLGRLDDWMQREEGMRAKRRFNDRLTWEGRRDFMMSLQAGFGWGRARTRSSTPTRWGPRWCRSTRSAASCDSTPRSWRHGSVMCWGVRSSPGPASWALAG